VYNGYNDRLNYTRGYFYTNPNELAEERGLPTKWEICDSCHGEGTRALRGMVVSNELLDDCEFMEDYMRGTYDTKCDDCHGDGKYKVVDEERCTPEQLAEWQESRREIAASNAESLMELRMGC
jgi:hypothetical protein